MAYDQTTGQGAVDRGELKAILDRRRREKKDQFYVTVEDGKAIVGKAIKLSLKTGDTIMILEDEFKSSYDCKTCSGVGEKIKTCLLCDGSGSIRVNPDRIDTCAKCDGKGSWIVTCADCNGKGALLEIPDEQKSRPTSGKIIVKGPDCKVYEIGERVAYTTYTGHLIPFKGNTRIRIMRESEPMCLIEEVENAPDNGDRVEFIDTDSAYVAP